MDVRGLVNLVKNVGETRNLEFKRSMHWADQHTKFKITKSIMAMSNIRDGGRIVFGVEQLPDNTFDPIGMTPDNAKSFNQDHVLDHVSKYARPYAKFMINRISEEQKYFIWIKVEQFDEVPVICGKDYYVDSKCEIKEGEIFTRTRRKYESSKVMDYVDLQEIINLAVDRGVKLFVERANRSRLSIKPSGKTDEEMFEDQIKELR